MTRDRDVPCDQEVRGGGAGEQEEDAEPEGPQEGGEQEHRGEVPQQGLGQGLQVSPDPSWHSSPLQDSCPEPNALFQGVLAANQ